MKEILETVFGLLGGLAMFIYGMNMMSDGLQKTAGDKMKRIIGILTKNPLLGVIAGALTTAVLQSSSATTCMVIGFVSAGLMSLPQAISVIIGANIGTTMTAQLLAFKISDYIYPLIFIGFIIHFISKNEKIKNIGLTIFSFGLLFVGIETMGGVMKPLASSPVFIDLIAKVKDIPILGVLVGALMTVVVQSSSATIAVLQNFASTPGADGASVLGLAGAIPILLGDNIGTTITALLASAGQSRDAKRTAVAHSVFNIVGSAIFICIIPIFAKFVAFISPKGAEIDIISRQIANAHTVFNITNTLLWLPFIWVMVKIVMFIVPEKVSEKARKGSLLEGIDIAREPAFALHMVGQELLRSTEMLKDIFASVEQAIIKPTASVINGIGTECGRVRDITKQATRFVSDMVTEGTLTKEQFNKAFSLMVIARDFDRMSQRSCDIANALNEIANSNLKFSYNAKREFEESLALIKEKFTQSAEALRTGEVDTAKIVIDSEQEISKMEEKYAIEHIQRLENGRCNPELTTVYNDILHCLERIGMHCVNLCKQVEEGNSFTSIAMSAQSEVKGA